MARILWPLVNNVIRRNKLSNTFGRFPERKTGTHWGWDFYAPRETSCYAIADGTIELIYGHSSDTKSFGLVAVLKFEHEGKDLYAAYCHLDGVAVKVGDSIAAGYRIGYTGNSGNATNMSGLDQHLHFEIRSSVRPPPGPGGRMSPIKVFGICPLREAIVEP